MADDYEDNDFEEDFQEADEPDDLNDDLEAADGDQEQIDVLPAGKFNLTARFHSFTLLRIYAPAFCVLNSL